MLEGFQMASPRSHRSHVGVMRMAMTDMDITHSSEELFEAEEAFWDVYSRNELLLNRLAAHKEMEHMVQPQSEHVSAFKTDEILEVMQEMAGRFSGVAESRQRGVRSTVGGIPAEYVDRLTHLHFVKEPAGLRRLAEEAQS